MMQAFPKAFIFDLNGTMIDDMQYHAEAWFDILNNDLSANMTRDQVKSHMYGKNSELLIRIFGEDHFSEEEMDKLSFEKERRYQKVFFPQLKLIEGLSSFLETAERNHVLMAIGSAAIPFNIDFVLDNLAIRHYFKVVVSADDVAISKPHPETFTKAASLLGVPPGDCIVFEDAPKGVEAAEAAGMRCIVLTTMHDRNEFSKYKNVIYSTENYRNLTPEFFTSLSE